MTSLSSRTALRLALLLVLSICAADFSLSDDGIRNEKNTNGFFPAKTPWFDDGDAKTVFAKEPAKTDSPDVGFYKEREEPTLEAEPIDQPQVINAKSAKPPFDTRSATPEQIRAFYGDPEKAPDLTPEENAPAPFKAMGAALDSGNEELAFQYARQYVRYVTDTSERVTTIDQLTDLAFEREGIRPAAMKNNPYRGVLNNDLAKAENGEAGEESDEQPALGQTRKWKIDELLKRAAQAEGAEESFNPAIPVDPKGEVQVLFFFDPKHQQAANFAANVEYARKKFMRDEKVKVTGYAISKDVTPDSLATFSREARINFPLLQRGLQVATTLGVKSLPAVVLLAPNAQKSFEIDNDIDGEQIIRAIAQMKGATPHA